MKLAQDIAGWIAKQVKDSGKKGVVMGLSGGIDSALVAVLCRMAVGEKLLGLLLPCQSGSFDAEHALMLAERFDIRTKKIELDDIYQKVAGLLPEGSDLARANLKPRIRMLVLYYFANSLDYLVAGTGNKSEISIGYFTKYGDGAADILPIGGLLKTEVIKLSGKMGIPREIRERAPSAGLWEGQTDEKEIGISYEKLDGAIAAIEKKKTRGIDKNLLGRVREMMKGSKHKRAPVPVFTKKTRSGI